MAEMILRQEIEEREAQILSPLACQSRFAKRQKPEEESRLRTAYQKDRDRILHSKAFRRLMNKTQVFFAPEGDHYRTRMTHTLEVCQIARTIARGLKINEDLAEAMSLGHDLGHTPFAHTGEDVLNELTPGGFEHNLQSIRVVEDIEAMNLTDHVRDGILNHRTHCKPQSLEGQVVRLSDKIAYINHDIDDAIRAGVLRLTDIPTDLLDILGHTHGQRISKMVHDMIEFSHGKEKVEMSPTIVEATYQLRKFMFDNVYLSAVVKKEEAKAQRVIKELYVYFMSHRVILEKHLKKPISESELLQETIDYIAGMTDRYAIHIYQELFLPKSWSLNAGET